MAQNRLAMIVTETSKGWRCITQPDHARLSHDLLSLWRTDDLPRHPRREDLLLAVREHDNGWQETDSAPRLDIEAGRPHDFTTLPTPDRLEVWRRGIARHRTERPYVAALIIEHARHLHENATPSPGEWAEFLAGLESLRHDALADAGLELERLLADYRWLHVADLISLVVCGGWREPFVRGDLSGRVAEDTLHLTPFPLAGATAFSVPCRYLERSGYGSDAQMATALAACRWGQLDFRIAP